jgi:hypothetical protein
MLQLFQSAIIQAPSGRGQSVAEAVDAVADKEDWNASPDIEPSRRLRRPVIIILEGMNGYEKQQARTPAATSSPGNSAGFVSRSNHLESRKSSAT